MDCLPETNTPLIVWQSHANNFQMRRQIYHDFPEARFIVMVRYPPRARDSALLAFSEALPEALPDATGHFFIQKPFSISKQNLDFMNEMGRRVCSDESIVAVRFEDLHMRTRETMQWLSHWLKIDWNDSLLQSTVRGVGWGKHSMYPVYGARFNVGTRVLTRVDYYTRAQSRIDLLKYDAYQYEFFAKWNYRPARRWSVLRFIALNILAYWPVRLQLRTLRQLLRNPKSEVRREVIGTFVEEHLKLARAFRQGYQRRHRNMFPPPVEKAFITGAKWPDLKISRGKTRDC